MGSSSAIVKHKVNLGVPMTDTETHMRIRVPDSLRDKLIEIAERNQRSLNSEVVARLEESLAKADEFQEMKKLVKVLQAQILETASHVENLESQMGNVCEHTGIAYDIPNWDWVE